MSEKLSNNNEKDPGHWDLRTILANGRRVMEGMQKEKPGDSEEEEELPQDAEALTRREALRRLAIGGAGLGIIGAGVKLVGDIKEYNEQQEVIRQRSDEFYAEVSGYEAQVKLKFDEVLFVDETGAPVAVVKMEDFKIDRDGEPYLLSPGTTNEYGIIEENVPGEWLDYVRTKLTEDNPDIFVDNEADIPRALSVRAQFIHALKDDEEPSLVNRIKNGSITTYEDIIRYFAEKPVFDSPEMTRQQFVEEKIEFSERMHPAAQSELRNLIVGLCAQESNFHNGLVSSANARGVFQILEEVWVKDYDQDPEDFKSLEKQVEIAGKHLSRMHSRMQDKAGELAMEQLRAVHGNDEEMMQVEVLVPLTLNSYNAGPDSVGEAVRKYFEGAENRAKQLTGRDLFLDIADFARQRDGGLLGSYGEHAREYVPRIYAKAAVLNEDFE